MGKGENGQNGRQGIEQVDTEMGSAGGKEGNGKINYVEKFLNRNPRKTRKTKIQQDRRKWFRRRLILRTIYDNTTLY